MAGEVISHFKVGGSYATINEWVAANQGDLVSGTISPVLVCHESKAGHQEQAVISGSTTSADYHMVIRAATPVEALAEGESEAEALGIKKRGFWFTGPNNGTPLSISDNYFDVTQIGIGMIASYGDRNAIAVNSPDSSDTKIRIRQNAIWFESGAATQKNGINIGYNYRSNIDIFSNIFIDLIDAVRDYVGGSAQEINIINNTFVRCTYPYLQYYYGTTLNFNNNAVFDCTEGWNPNDYSTNDLRDVSASNNAVNLSVVPANWSNTVTGLSASDFVDEPTDDYHADSGSIILIQTGLDVSSYGVTYDCDGQAWEAPYGIGFDQPGEITFSANITVTCLDAETLSPIEGVGVYVYAASGGDLTTGDEIGAGDSDASGQLIITAPYTIDQPYVAQGRKGSSSPYYQEGKAVGTHVLLGSNVNVYMISDED